MAYDDPAVAVCQYTKFRGEDPAATGYQRSSVAIHGAGVSITFGRSVLGTKPKMEIVTCNFTFADDYFYILNTRRIEANRCDTLEKAASSDGSTADERIEWEMNQASCFALYSDSYPSEDRWSKEVLAPLTELGVYPIPAAETGLRHAN